MNLQIGKLQEALDELVSAYKLDNPQSLNHYMTFPKAELSIDHPTVS